MAAKWPQGFVNDMFPATPLTPETGSWITMSPWLGGIIAYSGAAVGTFLPTLVAALRGVKLNPGGASFEDSPVFSADARARLAQHYTRMAGTLAFWKKQAEQYRRFHYYCLFWTIPASVAIPFLAQAIGTDSYAKWLLTLISAHTAILWAFHKGLKVEQNYRAFRQGESEFYDTYRRLLDRPETFGATEREQIATYFDTVENIRKLVRNAETDNLPSVEQLRSQLAVEPAVAGSPQSRSLPASKPPVI